MPADIEYVVVAKWGGWDPEAVLAWPERTYEDVRMVMQAAGAQQAAEQAKRSR